MRSRWKFVATLAVVVAAVCWVPAQTYGTGSPLQDQGSMMGQQAMHAPGAQNRLNWLSQQLNLSDSQKTQLQPILQNEEQQMMQVHSNSSLSQEQKRDQMMQIHHSYQSQINSVLTPEQRQKLAQLQEQQRQKHMGNMGGNQP